MYSTSAVGERDLIQLQERQGSKILAQFPPPPPPSKSRGNSLPRPTTLFNTDSDPTSQYEQHVADNSREVTPTEASTPTQMALSSFSTTATSATISAATSAIPVAGAVTATLESVTSPSVITTNSTQTHKDKSWAKFQQLSERPAIPQLWDLCDEDRQLLGTEEDSSDRHSSDEEFDIWVITNEQREYYTNQFKSMQSDLNGLLSGGVAKDFFEKSKLPVKELSIIWQLSDVNKDGALSLEEFFTAMHLVVLRRNNIELPKTLPPCLVPRLDGLAGQQQQQQLPQQKQHQQLSQHQQQPQQQQSHLQQQPLQQDQQTEGISPGAETLSPLNKEDPKILHPVAVRASPDSQVLLDGRDLSESTSYETLPDQQRSPTKRLSNSESQDFKNTVLNQSAIQRPVPKKPTVPGPGAIPPPPPFQTTMATDVTEAILSTCSSNYIGLAIPTSSSLPQGPKKEAPPPPPPRPKKNHSRSASLDLNRLGAPPAVPPRMSPNTAGAFEVYKRPEPSRIIASAIKTPDAISGNAEAEHEEIAVANDKWTNLPKSAVNVEGKQELRSAIRDHRERNIMLSRLNGELNQELLEVMEERIALEIQLEHLKPFPA